MQTTLQTGRPAEFAPEAIIQAGQELRDAGRNITGFALRQKVGGGNPSRLKQVWDEYLSSQSVTTAEPVAELPIEVAEELAMVTKTLTERLAMLAVELNDKAVKAAERRVAEVVRAAGDQREQAERELTDASSTVDDLENKLNEVRAESEVFEKRLAETQTISQKQAVELARIQMELAEQKKAVQSLMAERDQERAELATVKAQAAAAEETHQEQRKGTAEETHRVAERLTKIEADRDEAHQKAATAREEAAELRGQLEATKAQAAELIQALSSHQPSKTTRTKKTPPN